MLNSEKQKLVILVGIGVVTVVHAYFTYLLSPLWAEQRTLSSKLVSSIENADSEATELRRLQSAEHADLANQQFDRLVDRMKETIPTNPIISGYDLLANAFSGKDLEKGRPLPFEQSRFRAATSSSEITIPDYMMSTWNLFLPKVKLIPLGKAIAGFETKNPLIQISEISLSPNDETSERAKLVIDMPVKP